MSEKKKGSAPRGKPGNGTKKKASTGKKNPGKKNSKKKPSGRNMMSSLYSRIQKQSVPIKLVLVAVGVALLCYAIYQTSQCSHQSLVLETTQTATLDDAISANALTVRDEVVIMSDLTGVKVGAVENGAKVSNGETISMIFSSEDAAYAYQRIGEIDERIKEFESMVTAGEDSLLESALETNIHSKMIELTKALSDGDLEGAAEVRNDMLYFINKKQVATKEVTDFDELVASLHNEKSALAAKYSAAPGYVTAPTSGYYFDKADGYEQLLNTSMLETLTPEALSGIIEKHEGVTVGENVVGKIANDYRWYIVCEVSEIEADKLETGKSYTIKLPYSREEKVTAKLLYSNMSADGMRAALVFRCADMIGDLASVREQPIKIVVKSATGLAVKTSAIVTVDEERTVSGSDGKDITKTERVEGVYILWGNEVKFKKTDIEYLNDDIAVCRVKTGREWLKRYDKVILNTEGLYDGKIIRGV